MPATYAYADIAGLELCRPCGEILDERWTGTRDDLLNLVGQQPKDHLITGVDVGWVLIEFDEIDWELLGAPDDRKRRKLWKLWKLHEEGADVAAALRDALKSEV